MAGIYIHIPFCSSFCIYCSFYSITQSEQMDNYFKALFQEIKLRKGYFSKNDEISSIYIGGGTPSLVPIRHYVQLLEELRSNFELGAIKEFTFEMNPDDLNMDYARGLLSLGVNRVSLGVQSFIDEDLKWMNRRHNSAKIFEANEILKIVGINNISMDLIFGYQNLTNEKWVYNLNAMIDLKPNHISAYQMSIEPESVLGKKYAQGEYKDLDEDICLKQYNLLQNYLRLAGYEQYEISNFARDKHYSLHNSSYWSGVKYLGLGTSAHSYNGINRREWILDDVSKYIDGVMNGALAIEGEDLSLKDLFNEKIMVGLRTSKGVSLEELKSLSLDYYNNLEDRISKLNNLGLILSNGYLSIPEDRLFISDKIIVDLFVDE